MSPVIEPIPNPGCEVCGAKVPTYWRAWDGEGQGSVFLCGPCTSDMEKVAHCRCCMGTGLLVKRSAVELPRG